MAGLVVVEVLVVAGLAETTVLVVAGLRVDAGREVECATFGAVSLDPKVPVSYDG